MSPSQSSNPLHDALRRTAGRARRIPPALAAVLGAALVVTTLWALIQPPWQAPDEQVHFAYAQELASDGALPGNERKRPLSTEQSLALVAVDLNGVAFHPSVPAVWDPAVVRRWRAEQRSLPSAARHDGGGPNSAAPNPPLYYAYLAPAYWAAGAGTAIDRLSLMRIWSGLLLLVTVTATWLLAGELFARNRLLQTAAAGIVALQPELSYLSAMVNPDALASASWMLAAWLGVRVLNRGLTVRSAVALGAIGATAVLTKATGYPLLLGVLAVLALATWRLARRSASGWRRVAAAGLATALVPVAIWIGAAHALDRPVVNQVAGGGPAVTPLTMNYVDFARYLKRFYVPALSPHAISDGPLGQLWVNGAWGRFGFVDVNLPRDVQHGLQVLCLLAFAGALVLLARRRRRCSLWGPAYLVLLCLLMFGALHYADFQQLVAAQTAGEPPPPFMQGRYILPLVGIFAIAATAALALLPRRLQGAAVGVVLGGMWTLELLSIGLVMERYFA